MDFPFQVALISVIDKSLQNWQRIISEEKTESKIQNFGRFKINWWICLSHPYIILLSKLSIMTIEWIKSLNSRISVIERASLTIGLHSYLWYKETTEERIRTDMSMVISSLASQSNVFLLQGQLQLVLNLQP